MFRVTSKTEFTGEDLHTLQALHRKCIGPTHGRGFPLVTVAKMKYNFEHGEKYQSPPKK